MNVELKIEYVGMMGQGVAHGADGNIYFVPGALPGDQVLAKSEGKKKYRDAELVEVLVPSEQRTEPACKVFRECGGCDWLDWDYSAQLKAKETLLRRALERSQWMPEVFLPTKAADSSFGYRNRIQLHSDGKRLGFYKRRSHSVVDIPSCPVAHPALNEAIAKIRAEGVNGTRKIELSVQSDGQVLRQDNSPHGAAGFSQVNDAQNAWMREHVAFLLKASGASSVLELYAGNGNFTSAYLDQVQELFALDSSATALEQARALYGDRTHPRAAFVEAHIDGRVGKRLPAEFRRRYDTILLDPPRTGAEAVLEPLIHEGVKTVVYVSCAPVAFTKDVQCLKDNFRFDQVQIVDMFPHTRHIEFVALFSRLPS